MPPHLETQLLAAIKTLLLFKAGLMPLFIYLWLRKASHKRDSLTAAFLNVHAGV